jgi:hypothetical protein
MNLGIPPNTKSAMLHAEAILSYFLGTDDKIDTLIKCKPGDIELVCLDQSLYEALGAIKDSDGFNFRKLVKFIESVEIVSYKENFHKSRPVLTDVRVEELRKKALAKNQINGGN